MKRILNTLILMVLFHAGTSKLFASSQCYAIYSNHAPVTVFFEVEQWPDLFITYFLEPYTVRTVLVNVNYPSCDYASVDVKWDRYLEPGYQELRVLHILSNTLVFKPFYGSDGQLFAIQYNQVDY